jgi:hypothetical protein
VDDEHDDSQAKAGGSPAPAKLATAPVFRVVSKDGDGICHCESENAAEKRRGRKPSLPLSSLEPSEGARLLSRYREFGRLDQKDRAAIAERILQHEHDLLRD